MVEKQWSQGRVQSLADIALGAAKDAVPMLCHAVVKGVAQGKRAQAQHQKCRPGPAQGGEDGKQGRGPCEPLPILPENDARREIEAQFLNDSPFGGRPRETLKRNEPKPLGCPALEKKTNGSVAEATIPIVEEVQELRGSGRTGGEHAQVLVNLSGSSPDIQERRGSFLPSGRKTASTRARSKVVRGEP